MAFCRVVLTGENFWLWSWSVASMMNEWFHCFITIRIFTLFCRIFLCSTEIHFTIFLTDLMRARKKRRKNFKNAVSILIPDTTRKSNYTYVPVLFTCPADFKIQCRCDTRCRVKTKMHVLITFLRTSAWH